MEEINCLDCIHITDKYFDCEKWCGSKKGWYGYQTEEIRGDIDGRRYNNRNK